MKLIFTGTQGTGKSTMLNIVPIDNKITEVVRNLSKEGVKINRDGDEEGQDIIFNKYKELLSTDKDFVSDRGLTDVLAYSFYLNQVQKVVGDKLVLKQMGDLVEYNMNHPDVLYVYFPIEFPVVGDGVRDTDEEYRKTIDIIIKELLDVFCQDRYVTISGTVEEREKFLKDLIESRNE